METLTKDCIHCGKCTRKCSFLQKYSLDLQELARHPELAYHCFLCGACSRVPVSYTHLTLPTKA